MFGQDTEQKHIFEIVSRPVIKNVLQGFNGTVFAYGQTGSGKTFTMEGPNLHDETIKGIIPRTMDDIFENIYDADEKIEFVIQVSMMEIYNEKIQCLLDGKSFIF